jgi:hypothetical protein
MLKVCGLKVCDSRMLKNILGLKWKEETRDWNKSHEEELHDSFLIKYHYGNQIQEGEINVARGMCVCVCVCVCVCGGKTHIEFWWGNSRERDKRGKRHVLRGKGGETLTECWCGNSRERNNL